MFFLLLVAFLSLPAFAATPIGLADFIVKFNQQHRLQDVTVVSDELRQSVDKLNDVELGDNPIIPVLLAPLFGHYINDRHVDNIISIPYWATREVFKAVLLCTIEGLGAERTLQYLSKHALSSYVERLEIFVEICQKRGIDLHSWCNHLTPAEFALLQVVWGKEKATREQVNLAYYQLIRMQSAPVRVQFSNFLLRHQLYHLIPPPVIPHLLKYAHDHPRMISNLSLPQTMPNDITMLAPFPDINQYPTEYLRRLVDLYGFTELRQALRAVGHTAHFVSSLAGKLDSRGIRRN